MWPCTGGFRDHAVGTELRYQNRSQELMPKPSRDYHPAKRIAGKATAARSKVESIEIPKASKDAVVAIGNREVKLTNLKKPFWPELGTTKRDLIQYYADVSSYLLPHLIDRAMVMKRYPNGA